MNCERRRTLLIASLTVIASQFTEWIFVAVTGECRMSPYLYFSSLLALYVYDCLLTLPEEVSEIWPSKWSLTKMAYLSSRYGGMVAFFLETVGGLLVTDSVRVSLSSPCVCSHSHTTDVR